MDSFSLNTPAPPSLWAEWLVTGSNANGGIDIRLDANGGMVICDVDDKYHLEQDAETLRLMRLRDNLGNERVYELLVAKDNANLKARRDANPVNAHVR